MTSIAATDEDLAMFSSLRGHACPEGCFIGDGLKCVRRMLAHRNVERVLCSAEWVDRFAFPPEVEVRVAPREKIDAIAGVRLHQRVMAMGRIPDPGPIRGDFLVALDRVSSAENVGAILRTCAAFGVEGLLVGPGTASPWLRRAVRVSMAAGLVVPVHVVADLPAVLRGRPSWAAHIHGDKTDYTDVDYTRGCCLVLGSEADGVTQAVLQACRGTVYIPMAKEWDCINVAASAAVLLSEVARQRRVTR